MEEFLGNFTNMSSTNRTYHDCDRDNPDFQCTAEDFLFLNLGPRRQPLILAIPITVLYVLIGVTGVVGNVLVCIVIVRNSSMHTATNYYLFSLAISDLMLLLLGLPNDISVYWHQYPYGMGVGFCKLRALLSEASSYVSVLTIVAFSMERYLAICHPLHLYTMSGLQRAVRIIATLWLISLLFAAPFFLETTVHQLLTYPPNPNSTMPESAICGMLTPMPLGLPYMELSSILFFLLPAAVILALYCRMGLRIRARSRHHLGKGVKGSVHGETRQVQSRKAIIRMLAAVVIAFFVCWAPFHAQRLIFLHGTSWAHYKTINGWMFSVAGWLYYVSSTVNPILYNVMSNRYRVAFRETLCCWRKHSSGISRDQSSFRETTIVTTTDVSHLVRVRSVTADSLHRSNTQNRLSRHSTVSSTLSKEYTNLNHGVSQKSARWSDNKRSSSDSNNTKKSMNNSGFKAKFFNLNSQDKDNSPQRENSFYKKKEISFEIETSSLLNSEKDDNDISSIKIIGNLDGSKKINRLSDSRSDSQINNRKSCLVNSDIQPLTKVDIVSNVNKNSQSDFSDIKQDVLVVIGKGPSNGIKKYCTSNINKNTPYSNSLYLHADNGPSEEDCIKAKGNSDVSETCI